VETLTGSASGDDTVTILTTHFAGMFTSIDLGSGTDVLNVVASGNISAATAAALSNIETGNLTGTSGTDTITLSGSQLDAIIIGSGSINLGAGGVDTINLTSTSSDLNTLGSTDASIQGVEAISALAAGAGVTIILFGQSEAFTVTGSSGNDIIIGGIGNDVISSSGGNDIIIGSIGNDIMAGGSGNDIIDGGLGYDIIFGGDGNDILYGKSGLDTLWGNAGADTFMLESASAFSNVDVIRDFDIASYEDVLDISDILAATSYIHGVDLITNWVEIATSGFDSIVKVDRDGAGGVYGMTQIATLTGITGLTDEAALVSSGNLVVA